MAMTDAALASAARRAYELGRLRRASLALVPIAPATALSIASCHTPALSLAAGIALAAAAVGLLWYGRGPGRGAWPGLTAGALAYAVPFVYRAIGHVCVGGACVLMPTACVAGGVLAGLLLGVWLARRADGVALLAAAAVAGLAGTLGCVLMGAAGVAGMSLGLVAAATPAVLLVRASHASR